MDIGRQIDAQLAQTRQVYIGNRHLGTEPGSHSCSGFAHSSTAKYKHTSRQNAGNTTDKSAISSLRGLQIMCSIEYSHTACNLTHRYKQRQRTVCFLHRFISNTHSSALDHCLGECPFAGEMEIGEYHLPLTNKRILGRYGFLHLHNHICLGIDIRDIRQDFSTYCLIICILKTAILACGMLHVDFMTMLTEFVYACRSHANTVLIVLNFLWNTDFHSCFPFVIKVSSHRICNKYNDLFDWL